MNKEVLPLVSPPSTILPVSISAAIASPAVPDNLLELPARRLLDKFGSGRHAPGSGSAAALSGILAAKLLETVSSLTLQKAEYKPVHPTMELISGTIRDRHEPELRSSFQRDSDAFNKVIKARQLRDCAADPRERRQFQSQALEHLRTATDIPFGICKNCLALGQFALTMFDVGFQSARGDSGTAGSNAISGAFSALFVVYLNLRSFRGSAWASKTREQCDSLLQEAQRIQAELLTRVSRLQDGMEITAQMALNFGTSSE